MTDMANDIGADEIHPDLRRVAKFAPRQMVYPWSLPILRRLSKAGRSSNDGVDVMDLPGGAGARLYRPAGKDSPTPALLWIHGGGYLLGSPEQDDALCRRYVQRLGITVAAVRYRLAPEHPYPIPLEDCYRVLTWLAGLPGVDADRIAIGGASAGGGLTAALSFLARDRGEITPVLQVLSYPMLDDRTVGPDLEKPGFRLWNARSNRFGWTSYLGGADPAVAVPARRTDLVGLAPAWLGVGTLDLFCAEDLAYAARLNAAGVACEVHEVPGAFHGFDGLAPKAAVSQAYFDSQCASLHRALKV